MNRVGQYEYKSQENKKRSKARRILAHYNTNKKIEPVAQINETLNWHPEIRRNS